MGDLINNSDPNIRLVKSGFKEGPSAYKPDATIEDCERYLSLCPNGPWVNFAQETIREQKRINKEKESEFYHGCTSVEDFKSYLNKYPDAEFKNQCQEAIENLNWDSWNKKLKGCIRYLSLYPEGKHRKDAEKRIVELKKKSRKIVIITSVLLLCSFLLFCLLNWHPLRRFEVMLDSSAVSKWGEERLIFVSTNVSDSFIELRATEEWISFLPVMGEGSSIVFEKNAGNPREGTIYVTAYSSIFGWRYNSREKEIKISQESGLPSFLTIDKNELVFDKYGNAKTDDFLTINSDGVSVEALTDADWVSLGSIEIQPNTSSYSINLPIKVDKNPIGDRTAEVLILSSGLKRNLRICQESGLASYISLDKTTMLLSEDEVSLPEYYPCRINTDGTSWSVYSHPSWLSVTGDSVNNLLKIETRKNISDIKRGSIIVLSNKSS